MRPCFRTPTKVEPQTSANIIFVEVIDPHWYFPLSDRDQKLLEFADEFEERFVTQDREENRSIEDTLEIGWDMLSKLPESALTRIDRKTLEKYHPAYRKK